jgi:CheY-like chemotaxis protein
MRNRLLPSLLFGTHLVPHQNLRVLVIDDNVDAADMFGMLLEHEGYSSKTAYSAIDGLEIAARFNPHVIFCDLGMPVMSGYELAQKVRRQESEHRTLLVAVSGWGDERTRIRTKNAGFDAHLVKPASHVSIQTLLAEYRFELSLV